VAASILSGCEDPNLKTDVPENLNQRPNPEKQVEDITTTELTAEQFNYQINSLLDKIIQEEKGQNISQVFSSEAVTEGRIIRFKTEYGNGYFSIERGLRSQLIHDTFTPDQTALYLEISDHQGKAMIASWKNQDPADSHARRGGRRRASAADDGAHRLSGAQDRRGR